MPPDPAALLSAALAAKALSDAMHGGGSNRYRASEADSCRRQIWYRVSGHLPWPENPNKGMANVVGTALHDVTRAMFNVHGIEIDGLEYADDYTIEEQDNTQVQVDDIILSSRADGRLGDKALLEVKTTNEWTFKALEKVYQEDGNAAAVAKIRASYPYYYAQTQITAGMLGMPWIYLLVVVRDNLRIGLADRKGIRHCIVYPFDQAEYDKQVKRFKSVDRARISGKVPEPDYEPGSKGCAFCKFRYLCPSGDLYGEVHPGHVEA